MTSIAGRSPVKRDAMALVVHDVGLVLELLDPDAALHHALLLAQLGDGLDELAGRRHDQLRQRLRERRRLLDLEEDQPADRAVDEVDDVVEADRELVDVLPVDRRDEGPVDAAQDLVRDLVALVLEALDLVGHGRDRGLAFEETGVDLGRFVDAYGELGEPLEVLLVSRQDVQHARPGERRHPTAELQALLTAPFAPSSCDRRESHVERAALAHLALDFDAWRRGAARCA